MGDGGFEVRGGEVGGGQRGTFGAGVIGTMGMMGVAAVAPQDWHVGTGDTTDMK